MSNTTNLELSKKEYWDSVLFEAKLPRINSDKVYLHNITINFIKPFLEINRNKTLLEIGAGSSAWLPFFAKEFNLKVSGLDYSEIGCKLAEENLKILGLPYEQIIFQDIFKWDNDDKYDIVFSYGVVEHFSDAEIILNIIRNHLTPSGLVITLVPNLNGLIGLLSRIFVKPIYEIHKIYNKITLQKQHERVGLNNIITNYVGTFSLSVIPWTRSNIWICKQNSIQRRLTLRCVSIIDKLFSNIFMLLKLNLPSKYFSPYIVSISSNLERDEIQ